MPEVDRVTVSDLAERFRDGFDHLIVSASYEQRALDVWRELHAQAKGARFVCYNRNHSAYLEDNLKKFRLEDERAEVVPLDSDHPLITFTHLRDVFDRIASLGKSRILLDITGFTREALAMLIYLAEHRLASDSTLCAVYHRALSYGPSSTGGWLSQGVQEVRSVIGYPGAIAFGADTHLILLPGIEFERARHIIDAVHPARITVGQILRREGQAEEFLRRAERFVKRLVAFYAGLDVKFFSFLPYDPFVTRRNLAAVMREQGDNVVCASLNAKPSSIGACLAALDVPTVQLIYAQPICYNVADYSKPSGNCLVFEIPLEGQETRRHTLSEQLAGSATS